MAFLAWRGKHERPNAKACSLQHGQHTCRPSFAAFNMVAERGPCSSISPTGRSAQLAAGAPHTPGMGKLLELSQPSTWLTLPLRLVAERGPCSSICPTVGSAQSAAGAPHTPGMGKSLVLPHNLPEAQAGVWRRPVHAVSMVAANPRCQRGL